MHIGNKILEAISHTLNKQYSINIDQSDWELFKNPLPINDDGEIDIKKIEERQNKSIDIIKNILDIHGKADIIKFLGHLSSLEVGIQKLQSRVRDHIVHAINTFILGVYILEKVDFPPMNKYFADTFMWKICGPTHDLGYPVEISHNISNSFVDNINNIFQEMDSSSPRVKVKTCLQSLEQLCENDDANEIIQNRLTEWDLGINVKHYYSWLDKKNRIDHGVISALVQLKVIEALYHKNNHDRKNETIIQNGLDYNQLNFDIDIVSASSALFIHNIDLKYSGFSNKISINVAPLAFLLFLCDTFQEWDRYSYAKHVYSGDDFDINCTSNSVLLSVPVEIEKEMLKKLHKRLSGLLVKVNGKVAVSG